MTGDVFGSDECVDADDGDRHAGAAREHDAGRGDGHLHGGDEYGDARSDRRICPRGHVYTATIKGGASGAKDVAGNALAADRVGRSRPRCRRHDSDRI